MPAKGRIVTRPYDPAELEAIAAAAAARGLSTDQALALLGRDTCDVYLNDAAYWRNVPAQRVGVLHRRLSGHQEVAELPRAGTAWAAR